MGRECGRGVFVNGDGVNDALALLDAGEVRVAAPDGAGGWQVNEWLKKAMH